MSVRIIGNEQEIEWAKEALRNQCNDCPYLESCNEKAKENERQAISMVEQQIDSWSVRKEK